LGFSFQLNMHVTVAAIKAQLKSVALFILEKQRFLEPALGQPSSTEVQFVTDTIPGGHDDCTGQIPSGLRSRDQVSDAVTAVKFGSLAVENIGAKIG